VKDTTATLTWTAFQDGTQTDLGTFTIGVADQDGTVIVAAGTGVNDAGNGVYTYTFSQAKTGTLGRWTVTWSEAGGEDFVTYVEIIGSLLVGEYEMRLFDNSALTSTTVYLDATIVEARDAVLDQLETWTGRSWVPRFGQATARGTGAYSLWLADGIRQYGGTGWTADIQSIVSATVSGSAATVGNIVFDPLTSELIRTDGMWTVPTSSNPINVKVNYAYGMEHPVDGVERIVMLLVKDRLLASPISDRASSMSDEMGTLRFETPGRAGNVSNLPEVNEWVKAHRLVSRV
jgi:hypothetical protein